MSKSEREEIINQLKENVTNDDFWDFVEAQQIDRILTALDEEWS